MLFVGIVVLQNSAKVLMLSILFIMFMHGYVQSGAQIDIKSINL